VQYVNTALAGKANDNAVVHLTSTETISGSKTFTAPPNVPTPVGTGDVTNKGYVDTAIATVGAGSFVSTAGGAMTGPLTLSGNPTAPLQAAAKQYVDVAAAAKADLVGGAVPTSELGSGTASGLNCLLGSGAWGPCGSSANATAIQSVPVASGAPGNGQVLTYSSTSGQYAPATPSGAAGGIVTGPSSSQSIVQPVNPDERQQFERHPLCDADQYVERESEREFDWRDASDGDAVAMSTGNRYDWQFDVLRLHQWTRDSGAHDGDGRDVHRGSGIGDDCVYTEEHACGDLCIEQREQRDSRGDQ
jgi:hypothetical protein